MRSLQRKQLSTAPDELSIELDSQAALFWLRIKRWDVREALLLACGINPDAKDMRQWADEVMLLDEGQDEIDGRLDNAPVHISVREARQRWDAICQMECGYQYGNSETEEMSTRSVEEWLGVLYKAGWLKDKIWKDAIKRAPWLGAVVRPNSNFRVETAYKKTISARGGRVRAAELSAVNGPRNQKIFSRYQQLADKGKARNAASIIANEIKSLGAASIRGIIREMKKVKM